MPFELLGIINEVFREKMIDDLLMGKSSICQPECENYHLMMIKNTQKQSFNIFTLKILRD